MNENRRAMPQRGIPVWVWVVVALLVAQNAWCQPGEPRSPLAVGFTRVGVHELTGCKRGLGEITGTIHPLGALSKRANAPVGWLLDRVRCDTAARWVDLLLVRSYNGEIPPLDSAVRLGPSREDSWTVFVGSGDFDNDGSVDIALRSVLAGDISAKGKDIGNVYVLWGNERGEYRIEDTTQLQHDAVHWTSSPMGYGGDCDGDRIDDLLVFTGSGIDSSGGLVPTAEVLAYKGGRRWGEVGGRRAVWRWWEVPTVSEFSTPSYWDRIDADCDGEQDLVIYTNMALGGTGGLQVIYGSEGGGFPDTTAIEVLDYKPILGARSVLSDVTGDGVPDLVVGCGGRDVIEIFAGKPGQRLQELYGTGHDSADRANKRLPVRPWAHLWLPHAISDSWFRGTGAFNLGDADGDGVDEVWGESFPYIMGYSGRDILDSLGDIIYRGEVHYAYRLRDLQSNGFPVLVFTNNSRIGYYRIGGRPNEGSYTRYALPHAAGFRCEHATGVTEVGEPPKKPSLGLQLEPNPAGDHQQIKWEPQEGIAEVMVHTLSGEFCWRSEHPGLQGMAIWETSRVSSGVYTVTLNLGRITETVTTTITH